MEEGPWVPGHRRCSSTVVLLPELSCPAMVQPVISRQIGPTAAVYLLPLINTLLNKRKSVCHNTGKIRFCPVNEKINIKDN